MRFPFHVVAAFLLGLVFVSCNSNGFLFGKVNENDLYGVLGVGRDASKAEIKKAFRRITREHHPDIQETLEAKEAAKEYMIKVLRAYEVLSDDEKRLDFDSLGKIPGERLNPADFSAEEIFRHFHQESPILSKTKQLDSVTLLRRVMNFRGNRIFLIQIYDDACQSCRWFASTWESFAQSSLSEGGIVQMMRIDAYSSEGPKLMEILGAKYNSDAYVCAIVDGKRWWMHQLPPAVKARSNRGVDTALRDFVMGFLHDRSVEVSSVSQTTDTNSIISWLQEPREASSAVRVLVPPLMAEYVPLTLSMLHDGVVLTRSVPRAALLQFVESYCNTPVEVRDRQGELIPMPEFMVISKTPLPNETDPNGEVKVSCRGIEVGTSSAMSYRKASAFVSEHLPPRHSGMSGLPYMTGDMFFEVCQRHCLMWVRLRCDRPPNPSRLAVMREDYSPFKVGYACFDEEPTLLMALPEEMREEDVLVAIIDSEDGKPHFIHAVDHSEVAKALSTLLSKEAEPAPLFLSAPVSKFLETKSFPLTTKQYCFLCFMWILSFISPVWNNSYPFLMMYIVHRLMQRFNIAGINGDTPAENSSANSNTSPRHSATAPTQVSSAKSAAKPAIQKKEDPIRPYSSSDIEAAKKGRGFLILLISQGSAQAKTPSLPFLAEDTRFTVRRVPQDDTVWHAWLAEQHDSDVEEESSTEAFAIVAIRQGKMMAAVKPRTVSLETWLYDLVDGTVTANKSLPTS